MIICGLSWQALNTEELVQKISTGASGARVVFEGTTRSPSNGRQVTYLEYEAYESLAEKQLAEVTERAGAKWALDGIVAVHRIGRVDAGEVGVVVAVTSAHRSEAFDACAWVIDTIKHEVAIWKKEFYADGDSLWVGSTIHA
jgi:molybdopterin synthase catalytic subunit